MIIHRPIKVSNYRFNREGIIMKEYFVCSDIHGFYDTFFTSLINAGFDYYNPNHYIIICGDIFDRGSQAKELLKFLLEFQQLGRLVLIRGNHEDLLEACLEQLYARVNVSEHHWRNQTVDTIAQLTGLNKYDLMCGVYESDVLKDRLKPYFELVSKAVDYYEIDNYIFVHGWIPVSCEGVYYTYDKDWRNASKSAWEKARWYNGMDMAHNGIIEENKTIVCGHWHTGYGHYYLHNEGETQYDSFDVYIDKGIVALDACTAYSNKINIYKI